MTKRTTPFLVEGMSAEKRENRIARVFALIEPKSGRVATEGVRIQRTFVLYSYPTHHRSHSRQKLKKLGVRCLP